MFLCCVAVLHNQQHVHFTIVSPCSRRGQCTPPPAPGLLNFRNSQQSFGCGGGPVPGSEPPRSHGPATVSVKPPRARDRYSG